MININKNFLFILLINILAPTVVYGYMDPGTWSYILSIIVAFFAGFLFYIRSAWEKLKSLLNKFFKKSK
tara:strand:- start:3040 stop:3246 length:207 start_codon:yes stop_codon:yes gene_type:complete